MTAILTPEEMRATEARAMEAGSVTGLALMERAGAASVAVLQRWMAGAPDAAQAIAGRARPRAVVLSGPGNNGGDGFVIARLLAAAGWDVAVWFFGDAARLSADARANHDRWAAEHPVTNGAQAVAGQAALPDCALVVDALFGIGLARPLQGVFADLVRLVAACRGRGAAVLAVDIPSGLSAATGRLMGDAIRADLTVTFDSPKPGHLLEGGPDCCGALWVADIGIADFRPPACAELVGALRHYPEEPGDRFDPAAILHRGEGHKYSHGHCVVLSGGMGRSGAARLAARAALRAGAGLVTVGAPGSAMLECAAQLTEVMLRRCDGAADLEAMLADSRLRALCLGPGLGVARAGPLALAAARSGRALVLDADALTTFSDAPETLFAALHPGVVLTPHRGEFARLFPDLAAALDEDAALSKCAAVRQAAARAGATVLLKGRDTVIAAPDGALRVHLAAYGRAAPGLATAGAGDVLAGLIAGLMARGAAPLDAAAAAAWLHVEAARAFGPGLIASDLIEAVPGVLRGLSGGPAGLR